MTAAESSSTGTLIRAARQRRGLSQAELARRAGMPRSVVNAYERGNREPGADALRRLVRAAGSEVALAPAPPVDADRAARILEQVLELAESLPYRPSKTLRCPPFRERLAASR